jgi:hypothetical protein
MPCKRSSQLSYTPIFVNDLMVVNGDSRSRTGDLPDFTSGRSSQLSYTPVFDEKRTSPFAGAKLSVFMKSKTSGAHF